MKYAITVLILAITVQISAQTEKIISSKITDVTVFLSGAQVTHTADVTLKAGENILKLNDLTVYIDPNSVSVEGNPNYTILSVRHQVNYLTDQTVSPEVRQIMDSLEYLQYNLQELTALKNVVSWEKSVFENNRDMKGTDAVLLPEDVAEMADLVRTRMKEIEYKWLDLTQQERKNNKDIQRLNNQLNALNARKGTNPSEILVKLDAAKAGTAQLKVTYTVTNAGWVPVYDLRAEEINSPIELIYKAKVYQSTGNDWEDVNLTISTGNPSVGGQSPELFPWYLYLYEPQPMYESATYGRAMNATPSVAEGAYREKDKAEDSEFVAQTLANYTTVTNNTVSTEFKISIPYDIPSDNQQYDVEMQREKVKATYTHFTIPKLDNDAFLRAQLVDWMQYSLIPGESNIYFKGTYVGKGYIDPAQANDTLNVSLGRDRAVNIKREQISDYCKTTSFMGKQKTTKAYEISITNTKKQAINLVVEDQLPISQTSDIEVETEELSGGSYNDQTGKVTWTLTLQPGETIKKQLRFNVKYPKKKLVAGL